MQGGRDPFFGSGDPFGGFGGFGGQRSLISGDPFGGFEGQRSLISSFFGGRDPFDDPFFTRPFGSMFESSFFGSAGGPFMNPQASGFLEGPFMNPQASGFLEHHPLQPNLSMHPPQPNLSMHPPQSNLSMHPLQPNLSMHPLQPNLSMHPPQPNMSRGPIIEELNSDDEKDEKESGRERQDNPRKHGRSTQEPFVEDPDDEATEKRSKYIPRQNEINQMQHVRSQPQAHSFTFQSSTVSYGGANGAYYTSSRTRRTGSDGLSFEECKEADSSTRQATHRVSRGIHDKGHSVTRKLNSDGHVDTMQTLHNLNEVELTGFEEAWKGNVRKHLPGLSEGLANQDAMGSGNTSQHRPNRGGWALPSTERTNREGSSNPDVAAMVGPPRHSGRTRADFTDGTAGSSRNKSNGTGSTRQANRR